ncbi:MAG: tryptophan synthase subunit alpha [Elusimicrobia bacterium]|nr:tryptophan synthase subunit alpha [Elusimicrobiota bacterium]
MSLAQALARRRASGRCGFVPFLTAGDPTLAATRGYLEALTRAGADIVELGVPFSDPVADGPVIQAADMRALKAGATLTKVLDLVRSSRGNGLRTPVIVFTYLNPVMSLGLAAFAKRCARSGVDGVLAVDLPAEASGPLSAQLGRNGVELVLLASPTTSDERLRAIGRKSGSIVYYVSREGVTGVRRGLAPRLAARLKRVRALTGKSLIVGFGVSRRAQARALARHADGVVAGSALVAAAASGGKKALAKAAREICGGLAC